MRWYFWELPFNVLKCPENRRQSCHLTENTPFFCGLKSLLQVISNPLQRLTRKDENQYKVIIHSASMNLPVYYYLSFFKTLAAYNTTLQNIHAFSTKTGNSDLEQYWNNWKNDIIFFCD